MFHEDKQREIVNGMLKFEVHGSVRDPLPATFFFTTIVYRDILVSYQDTCHEPSLRTSRLQLTSATPRSSLYTNPPSS